MASATGCVHCWHTLKWGEHLCCQVKCLALLNEIPTMDRHMMGHLGPHENTAWRGCVCLGEQRIVS